MNRTIRFTEDVYFGAALVTGVVALGLTWMYAGKGSLLWLFGVWVIAVSVVTAIRTYGVTITLSPVAVRRQSPFGEWQMRWDEVDCVEIGPGCTTLLLQGAGKRIWMARPASSIESFLKWQYSDDADEDPLVTRVLEAAEAHGAVFTNGWLTPFKTSRAEREPAVG